MFTISLKNEPASYLLCTCQCFTVRFWWKVRHANVKHRWRQETASVSSKKHNQTLNNRGTHLYSDSQIRWMQWYLQVAMISWHKMLFVSVLLLVRPLALLQFLFFSPIALPGLISTLRLFYSCCRYSVTKTETTPPLPASCTYKSWSSIISHTHTQSGEHRFVRDW